MKDEIKKEAVAKMDKALDALGADFLKLRSGRASVAMLDGIKVDYYGALTPLNQLANLSVPEPRSIVIQPFDVTQLQAVEKAITNSDLGFVPNNDGKLIRINIPQLTEERRKELVKIAKKYSEECKVSIRNSRRDANEMLKELEKEKEITQDELKKAQHGIQELTDKEVARVDGHLVKKEEEMMEV